MKKSSMVSLALASSVLAVCVPTDAALQVRGTDSLGIRLIYDTDLDLTWYDFTHTNNNSPSSWYTHMAWADGLAVTLNGVVYDDWRLPTMLLMEDPPVWAFSGTTSYGFNITTSEMGHLFHTELSNIGRYETTGVDRGPEIRLVNVSPFLNLLPVRYYNDVTYPLNVWSAGHFDFGYGEQYVTAKEALGGTGNYGIAVRRGDVIPEPAGLTVLSVAVTLLARRLWPAPSAP